MINYKDFVNKPIINKNNETGVVLSFDKDLIVIKYAATEETYNTEVALINGFIIFKDESLQQASNQSVQIQQTAVQKHEEEIAEKYRENLAKRKKVSEILKKLSAKNEILQGLFGYDFECSPYVEFKKKYKAYIEVKRERRRININRF